MSQEIYNKTVFKRFFEENDPAVMAWAENVFEKVAHPGILPTFIKKDGEDFQAYWSAVCHLFALVVLYSRQYNEIDTNKILFELFIENRGLITSEVDTQEQMKFLFDNYVDEYRKRGRMDIVSKEGTILGELLRLIQYNNLDEFIFALLMNRDTGWTMGYSSPCWNRADTVLNITKGYETTTNIVDLNKYPLINSTGVRIVDDFDNEGNPIKAMNFVGNSLVGISSTTDKSKLLTITENLAYQISAKVKISDTSSQKLHFGVQLYNEDQQPVQAIEAFTPPKYQHINPNYLLDSEEGYVVAPPEGQYTFITFNSIGIIQPNTKYTVSILQSRILQGSFNVYNVLLYDFSASGAISDYAYFKVGQEKQVYTLTTTNFVPDISHQYAILVYAGLTSQTGGNGIQVIRVKLELGTEASDWAPSAKDKIIQDRNMFTNGDTILNSNTYRIGAYNRSLFTIGKYYTLIFAYQIGSTNTKIIPYQDEWYISIGSFYSKKEIIESITFKATAGRNNESCAFYQFPDGTFGGSYVRWGVLIEGNEISEDWEPVSNPRDTGIPKESTNFVSSAAGSDGYLNLPNAAMYYEVRGTISKTNRQFSEELKLNFPYGRGLKFKPGADTKYLGLELTQDRSTAANSIQGVYIYDIKIKPVYLPFYQGHLGEKNIIAAYFENNSLSSNETVKKFIDTYLVSYKNIFAGSEIYANQLVYTTLKVISDRGAYLQGVAIYIANQTYITDVNGEAKLDLYPGDYAITLDKNRFTPIKDELLTIGEMEDQVIYYTMIGELYERKITFVVKDSANIPMANATVTFNGQIAATGNDGTVAFYAYPGLYSYTVTKDKYYVVDKSVLIVDDMSEPVTMVLIPVYVLTFVVLNGSTPVPNATVALGTRSVQTAITDSTGTAIFRDLVQGIYPYSVEKSEWNPVTGEFVEVNGNKTVNVQMTPIPTYTITFQVNNYNPTSGSKVPFNNVPVSFAGITKNTASNGQVSFVVKGGTYSYNVAYPGYVTQNNPAYVVNRDATITIDLAQNQYKTTIKVLGANNQPIAGAEVTVGTQKITTTSGGVADFNLTNGIYSYQVKYTEYHEKTGNFTVNNAAQTITVTLDQKTYQVQFTVKEDGAISKGALVTFNGNTLPTDNVYGQATFYVPVRTEAYTYSVSKTYYGTQSGSVVMSGTPQAVTVNLVRNQQKVTFYVINDLMSPVEGAMVTFNGQTGYTGSNGRVILTAPSGSTQEYTVSKLPDYIGQSGTVTVGTTDLEEKVTLSNKTYKVFITVKSPTGRNLPNIICVLNGKGATTNSSGIATFNDFKTGTYTLTLVNTYYKSYSANVGVNGADTYFTANLQYELAYGDITVLKDGNALSGQAVGITIYDRNSDFYSSVTINTNGYGNASYEGPKGGSATVDVSNSECVSVSDTMSTGNTLYIYLYKALILRFNNSSSTPSGLGSADYDRSGNTVRCFKNAKNNPSSAQNLSISCSGMSSLVEIVQWPISGYIMGQSGVFSNCTGLNSIASGSPRISGNVIQWFKNTPSLRTIPAGLFLNMTGSQATETFRGSGITSTSSSPLFPDSCICYASTFRECGNLTQIGDSIFGKGGGVDSNGDGDFHATFMACPQLTRVGGSNTTNWCFRRTTNGTTFDYTFSDCTNLIEVGWLWSANGGFTKVSNCTSMFSGCSKLTSYPANMFTLPGNVTNMNNVFRSSGITYQPHIPNTCQTAVATCYGCKSLTEAATLADGAGQRLGSLRSIYQFYAYSGVRSVSSGFFSYTSSLILTDCSQVFLGCSSLVDLDYSTVVMAKPATTRTTGIYVIKLFDNTGLVNNGTPNINFTGFFQDCTNLRAPSNSSYMDTQYGVNILRSGTPTWGNANMQNMFINCSRLRISAYTPYVTNQNSYWFWNCNIGNVSNTSGCFRGTPMAELAPSSWK